MCDPPLPQILLRQRSKIRVRSTLLCVPLTLAVPVLLLALTHRAVSLVWNWQVQKFGQCDHPLKNAA
jgi:hypothetical protein